MSHMRRISTALFASLALALLLPAGSSATLAEVGVLGTTSPPTVASCPGTPCLAVSRTTGLQVQVGRANHPMKVPRSGTIVAWTVSLGKPDTTQINFFTANEGGAAEAGIAILRLQRKPNLTY